MPTTKSPSLLKTEALARMGNSLNSVPALVARAQALIENGMPADERTGVPAISGEEIAGVIGADWVAKIARLSEALSIPTE